MKDGMAITSTTNFFFIVKEEEEREEITPELVARLVTRPEDLPQNVAASIKKYRDMMLRTLEVCNMFTVHIVPQLDWYNQIDINIIYIIYTVSLWTYLFENVVNFDELIFCIRVSYVKNDLSVIKLKWIGFKCVFSP